MKLSRVKPEHVELKKWLTGLLPEDLSRQDVAIELDVTRKTISTMLSPANPSFGKGLTMLRYLQLAGAVSDAPAVREPSRLEELQAEVERMTTVLEKLVQQTTRIEERLDDPGAPGQTAHS